MRSLPQAKQTPAHLAFVHRRGVAALCSTLIIFLVLFWIHSNRTMSFLYLWAKSWTQLSSWSHKSRGPKSPLSTCWSCLTWCSQGPVGFLGCRHTLLAHFHIFKRWCSPSPSPQGCSQSIHHSVCTYIGYCIDPGAGPCAQPHWTSSFSLLQPVTLPVDVIPSLQHINCSA